MFVLPLVGWGMLSAARYPIVLLGSLHLPFILPHDVMLYAVLRKAYTRLQAGRGIGSFGSYDTTQTVPKERHDF
jgi:hypothetical protein